MTENQMPPSGAPQQPGGAPQRPWQPTPGTAPPTIPLMRREQNKVVAGVCSGVAYRLGIDPNVVRVVAVVLTIFGGVGILLYALGWLLLPEQGTGRSLGERALRGGGPDGATTILLALGLAVIVLGFGFAVVGDSWFGLTVLALTLGVGAVLLARRPTGAAAPGSPTLPPSAAPPTSSWTQASPGAGGQQPVPAPGPAYAGTYGTYDTPLAPYEPPYPYGLPEDQPAPTAEPKGRSVLGLVTGFAALAAVGILGVIDIAGATIPFSGYLAAALTVVGLGLVVGAWFGRSRGLIAGGVALTIVLVPTVAIEQLGISAPDGDRFETSTVTPETTAELDGAVFEHGSGDIRYDFTAVNFSGQDVETDIRMGAGNLQIDVPEDVTLIVDARVVAGEVDLLGEQSSGLGVNREQTYEGEDDAGTLQLDVRVGFGNVEITEVEVER